MNHRTESQLLQELSDVWSLLDMERRGRALAVAAERERCIRIIEAHQVPVGNSAAGEMAAEWTMDALRAIRQAIRGES